MAKIVISKSNPKRDKRSLVVPLKKYLSASGKITKIPTLDSEDPKFGLKLEAVFRRNVAKVTNTGKATRSSHRAAAKKR
jgi:hypothetical protein